MFSDHIATALVADRRASLREAVAPRQRRRPLKRPRG
jgi:hypothetical protein